MNSRALISLWMILTVLFAVGCRRIDSAGDTGDLVLHLSVGDVETKASMQEGEQFKNLLVVTVDAQSTTQRQYVELGSSSDYTSVVFNDLAAGECQVYAFANIDHTAWLENADDIESIKTGTIAVDADKLLKILTGTSVPESVPDNGAMLLTGQKLVIVQSGEKNIGEVKLYRPVARLNVSIHNNTERPITLNSLSFSNFNANKSYLLPSMDDSGIPVIPADAEYRQLPSLANAGIEVDAGKTATVYSSLLYENIATDEYRMMAGVSLDNEELNLGSRLHFKVDLNNNKKNVTVSQTNDPVQDPNTDTSIQIWLSYGDGELIRLYRTANNIYEITIDLGASLGDVASNGFRIKQNTNTWWGANTTTRHLSLGTPYSLRQNNSASTITFTGGALLRFIDPETSQVSPVTYIRRNQEMTVVLNIYHEVTAADFDIQVISDTWTGDGKESTHTFE